MTRRTRHDVAIYAPRATGMYERRPVRVGGAERQMTLLAKGLAERGARVAHVVFAPADPLVPDGLDLTLVPRDPYVAGRSPVSRARETVRIWRALRRADASTYIVRGSTPALGVAALLCRSLGRRLVFSAANDLDFTLERFADHGSRTSLYTFGVRSADAVVVQSRRQLELAHRAFPHVRRLVTIPSFGEAPEDVAAAAPPPEAFLWIGRLIEYKRPLAYLQLARELPEARFWMIGVDNERDPTAAEVREQAASLPNVELLETRPHAETMELLRRAAAVVSTSRAEGMPNIFLEAWSRGVPVLTWEFDPDGVITREGLGIAAGTSWDRFRAGAHAIWTGEFDTTTARRRAMAYIRATHAPEAVTRRWGEFLTHL